MIPPVYVFRMNQALSSSLQQAIWPVIWPAEWHARKRYCEGQCALVLMLTWAAPWLMTALTSISVSFAEWLFFCPRRWDFLGQVSGSRRDSVSLDLAEAPVQFSLRNAPSFLCTFESLTNSTQAVHSSCTLFTFCLFAVSVIPLLHSPERNTTQFWFAGADNKT